MTPLPTGPFRDAFDTLHERAAERAGCSDFGDAGYREALAQLLAGYDDEAILSEEGRERTLALIVDCLVGRLLANARRAERPECLEAPIERPLVIAGLPRTGSTALHKLLAADPGSQALEYWLARQPAARPASSEWERHPSYRAALDDLRGIYAGSPELLAAHAMRAGEADECRLLFMQEFMSVSFSFNATLPSYERWIFEQDFRPAYARYRDDLKLIGANDPDKRWVLKNSSHLFALPALEETFPDVCLLQTHRNPVTWISSIASVVHKSRTLYEPDVSKEEVGEQQLRQWSRVIDASRRDREKLSCPVVDVHYDHFLADPLGTVRRIYEAFDWPWSPEAERAIRQWADENRQHADGVHVYSADEYGLDEARIVERFGDYIEWEQEILRSG